MIEIDKLIMDAAKSGKTLEKEVYRLIKAKFLEFKTSKEQKPFTYEAQVSILKKMIKEREDSAKMYTDAGRTELATRELAECDIIKTLLPEEPSEEEIKAYLTELVKDKTVTKKDMKPLMSEMKTKFPFSEGKTLSQLIISMING